MLAARGGFVTCCSSHGLFLADGWPFLPIEMYPIAGIAGVAPGCVIGMSGIFACGVGRVDGEFTVSAGSGARICSFQPKQILSNLSEMSEQTIWKESDGKETSKRLWVLLGVYLNDECLHYCTDVYRIDLD